MSSKYKKDIEDIYPLSPLQKGILFHHLYDQNAGTYFEQLVLRISGKIDLENYRKAWEWVIGRHPILRTAFVWEKLDEPVQVVKRTGKIDLTEEDWRHLESSEIEKKLEIYAIEDRKKGFDLTGGNLMRTSFIYVSDDELYMIWSYHHILLDGWSATQVNTEVLFAYTSYANGKTPFLPEPRPYRDYIAWLKKKDESEASVYWKNLLKGITAPTSIKDVSLLGKSNKDNASHEDFGVFNHVISEEIFSAIKNFAKTEKLTVNSIVQGAWSLLLSQYSGTTEVVFGVTVSGRPPEMRSVESMVGLFINNLPTRINVNPNRNKTQWLQEIQNTQIEMQQFEYSQLVDIQGWSDVPRGTPLFESFVNFENQPIGDSDSNFLGDLKILDVEHKYSPTGYPLAVFIEPADELTVRFLHDRNIFDDAVLDRLAAHFQRLLEGLINPSYDILGQIPILKSEEENRQIYAFNDTSLDYDKDFSLHQLIEKQVDISPDAVAIQYLEKTLTYRELDERSNQVANYLLEKGIEKEEVIGIMLDRSTDLIVCLLGILKAGATYLPLDPTYPEDRLNFMIEDSKVRYIVIHGYLSKQVSGELIQIDLEQNDIGLMSKDRTNLRVEADNLAYLIYTSGSTGKPKGVMVTHRNAVNFCAAMSRLFPTEERANWLAVTSITFDISVLELFWTLSRGEKIFIRGDNNFGQTAVRPRTPAPSARKIDFSLFYFASNETENEQNKYQLLLDGADFADRHGFKAVWTPERHFHEFGGLYPQPAITGAALSTITKNVQIRAGSVVLPLTHPIRVAEGWSVIDNLSGGRAGISIASGWHVDDFVFAPENFADRHNLMFEGIETIRRLWRGEQIDFVGGAGNKVPVKILPRPVQKEVPIWVTAAGNPETFRKAGEIGANLLTHLLGQNLDDLGEKIKVYKQAWRDAGHAGDGGTVTLMIHAFVWTDSESVVEMVKEPFKQYLNSSVGLINNLAKSSGMDVDVSHFTDADREALLEHAFNRYFETSGLFGTPETCLQMVESFKRIEVDEVACLIDFGIAAETVLESLNYLNIVRMLSDSKKVSEKSAPVSTKRELPRRENFFQIAPKKEDESIGAQMRREEIDSFQCTPSLMKMLLEEDNSLEKLSSLKNLLLGGEALSLDLIEHLKLVPANVTNMYGPTEATVWALSNAVEKNADKIVIGKPIGNMKAYVLNDSLQPVPFGVSGEIYLGGDGISRGYRNRPEITAENFIPDPFGTEPGKRIYRTGDVGRMLESGEIEFLGRSDNQIKIRGHRIEIGEIETVLLKHPNVTGAVIVATKDSFDENILTAFIVTIQANTTLIHEWKSFIGQTLPNHMIPSVFIEVDELPLTPNGKINRKALVENAAAPVNRELEISEPVTQIEKELVTLWTEMLQAEKIGTNQNFFELGGHSLLATRLISRVRQIYKVEINLQEFFEKPTIRQLALAIGSLKEEGEQAESLPKITRIEHRENLPLSFAQQRLWFLHKLSPEDIGYNIPVAVKLNGKLDIAILEKTLNEIVRRHEILRTVYDIVDDNSVQIIKPYEQFELPVTVLDDITAEERYRHAFEMLKTKAKIPFDLTDGKVFRPELIVLDAETNIVLLSMHHIVSDAWSRTILIEEFSRIYKSFAENEAYLSEIPEIQYADYAVWQRQWLKDEILTKQMNYWKRQLAEITPLNLPLDFPRPALQTSNGARHRFKLDDRITASLREISIGNGTTLYATLLASFQVLLAKYSQQKDIAVGTLIAGRQHIETEKLLGFFINTLVIRADVKPEISFREFLGEVKNTAVKAFANQDFPFEKLVDELQTKRDLSRNPLFQASFNLQNAPVKDLDLPGLSMEIIPLEIETTQFDLALEMREENDEISAIFEYNSDLFTANTIETIAERYLHLLDEIIENTENTIDRLSLIDNAETAEQLKRHQPASFEISDINIVGLFEQQVEKTPDAIAVSDAAESLTYRELNQRANQLARALSNNGVGRESLVGLYLERNVSLTIAVLGVLKAGGGYVPLDPAYPSERLAYMATDAKVEVVIRNCDWKDDGRIGNVESEIDLRREETWRENSSENIGTKIEGEQLAYVIYTSGSTGRPKGVVIEHKAIANHLLAIQKTFGYQADDKVLQFASLNFDVGLEQLLAPVLMGISVYIRGNNLWTSEDLARHLKELELTVINLPTAYWHQLVQAGIANEDFQIENNLRTTIIGGDAIKPSVVEKWQQTGLGKSRLINAYGPTEAVITATTYDIHAEDLSDEKRIPIGNRVGQRGIYILDEKGALTAAGIPGEIHIAGHYLARGYLNFPEMTAEKFVPDALSGIPGTRLYRTGDLGKYTLDGAIEFLGRTDDQVKIRGFRIETGEIETAIESFGKVSEAIVIVHAPEDEEKKLVAYAATENGTDARQIEDYLSKKLPAHLIPSQIITLDKMPLTPNGKIDRNALPPPNQILTETKTNNLPQGEKEIILSEIWKEVLKIQQVQNDDNFFSLGGDSISSLQVISKVRKTGFVLKPRQIFENETLSKQAAVMMKVDESSMFDEEVSGLIPLTPVQARYFTQENIAPNHFNQSLMLIPSKKLEPAVLKETFVQILKYHDALRISFGIENGEWKQFNEESANCENTFEHVDLSDLENNEKYEAVKKYAGKVQSEFVLQKAPLIRMILFEQGEKESQKLLIVANHLVIDGVSWRILLEDIENIYEQLAAKKNWEMPSKTTSYKGWANKLAEHAKGDEIRKEIDYWKKIGNVDLMTITDSNAPQKLKLKDLELLTLELGDAETKTLLKKAARQDGSGIEEFLLAGLTRALSNWKGDGNYQIEVEGHGREALFDEVDLSHSIGWFTSIYPVNLTCNSDSSWTENVDTVSRILKEIPGKGIGYGLLRYLSPDENVRKEMREISRAEILFNYLGKFENSTDEGKLFRIDEEEIENQISPENNQQYPLEINALIADSKLKIAFNFNAKALSKNEMTDLRDLYLTQIRNFIDQEIVKADVQLDPADFPLASGNPTSESLTKLSRKYDDLEDIYDLTPLQEGLLFHSLYEISESLYVGQTVIGVEGDLNAELLEKAFQKVVDIHPILRTGFVWENQPKPRQVVLRHVRLPFAIEDWSDLSDERQAADFELFLEADRRRGFVLEQAPLMRLTLIRCAENKYRLIWSHHHLLLDGWSSALILQQVLSSYESLLKKEPVRLPVSRPYRDYIQWLRQQDETKARDYWREYLNGVEGTTRLGIERRRRTAGTTAEAEVTAATEQISEAATKQISETATEQLFKEEQGYRETEVTLNEAETVAAREYVRRAKQTLNTLVQGAWSVLASRYSGQSEVLFGATVAGRPAELSGFEEMVGLFINTLPVRVKLSGEETVDQLLERIGRMAVEQREYEYSSLTQIRKASGMTGGGEMFEQIVVFENYPVDEALKNQPLSFIVSEIKDIERINYGFALVVRPGQESISVKVLYSKQLFSDADIEALLRNYLNILRSMIGNPEQSVKEIALASGAEKKQLTAEWNATETDYPKEKTLIELFAEQVLQNPKSAAVEDNGKTLSYEELDEASNRLANHLRQFGIGTETLVAICLERSSAAIIATLAVIKTGGAYVPLDINYPPERIQLIAEDSKLEAIITDEKFTHEPVLAGIPIIRIDTDQSKISKTSSAPLYTSVRAENLAYVIYTSGSTGKPKGVAVNQYSITRLVLNTNYISLTKDARIGQIATLAFDAATFEIWGALLNGGTIVIIDRETSLMPKLLEEFLKKRNVSDMFITTALFNQIAREAPAAFGNLKSLLFGGESVNVAAVREVLKANAPERLLHVYGPTESTTFSNFYEIEQVDAQAVNIPIGKPLSNTKNYVLDERLNLVSVGQIGELYIAGDGLARGYLNQPGLTAEKFIPDPHSGTIGDRMYVTGDQVRLLENGNIEFVGRRDFQVKIRGYRIELGEIESVLLIHPQVDEAIVLVKDSELRGKQLTGFVVADRNEVTAGKIKQFAANLLPDYMIPPTLFLLDKMPLSENGKIDRRVLFDLAETSKNEHENKDFARDEVEEKLVEIWKNFLEVDKIGIYDSFYELGGHSLLATQIVSAIKSDFEVEMSLKDFLTLPTISENARLVRESLERKNVSVETIVAGRDKADIPLSFSQQRLWFFSQLQPDSPLFNLTLSFTLEGNLDTKSLTKAFDTIIERHEILRTNFLTVEGIGRQKIHEHRQMPFVEIDLIGKESRSQNEEIERLINEELQTPFDLESDALIRGKLLKVAPAKSIFLLSMHHIVSDGWSMGIFSREFAGLYESYTENKNIELPQLPFQYADFAVWQKDSLKGEYLENLLGFWKEKLAGLPPLNIPKDRPYPENRTYQGASEQIFISKEQTLKTKELAGSEEVSMFMILLTVYQLMLFYLTGQKDIGVGSDIANRHRKETENMIGFLVNQIVLRNQITPEASFREHLKNVKRSTIEAYDHQDLPFDLLVEAINPERSLQVSPIFQTKLVFQNSPLKPLKLSKLEITPQQTDFTMAKLDLTLLIGETEKGLEGNFEYSTEIFDKNTIKRFKELFLEILELSVSKPNLSVEEIISEISKKEESKMKAKFEETSQNNRSRLSGFKSAKKKSAVVPDSLVNKAKWKEELNLPIVFTPSQPEIDLPVWASLNRKEIEEALQTGGAVLFRGFDIELDTEFEKFAASICELFHENGEHPREQVNGKIYTPVFYPADQHLLWHNENSFNHRFPGKIMFSCVIPAETGGETTIVDSRLVFKELADDIKNKFIEKQVMYVRNYDQALGLDWRNVFQTDSREEVEKICEKSKMKAEWKSDDRLRTICVRPAVIEHPVTGEISWFNQAQHWHTSCLSQETQKSLYSLFDETDLPRQCYYGDGSPIEAATMKSILDVYQKLEVRFPWQRGDIMVLDNILTAHARRPFTGARKLLVAMGDMRSFDEN